ncbi:MAG: methyltransferase domain-containing protein [Lachnospiraceae bacterium]|nr:methyltransferase domain-containing protein [Lachnospiraceae bacterium]MCH4063207.1 methyltransferase domain-containing protein [Lachnospiraceae bacterium]MCH4105030.1 methyltransferase domain-containing protein [Lachnospiraceae bacterium]MCI1308488.1 methyltransferase domain-containing protein [Lachnospiraceae bacterium]MCI1333114.1 methyltransferase domain-containing protein [Lachnospiraceae bacterium]
MFGFGSGREGSGCSQTFRERLRSRRLTEWALSQLVIEPDDHILDVGCGGGDALYVISRENPGGRCYGVDISEAALAASRRKNIASVRSGKMRFYKASVSHLPFDDQCLHTVIAIDTYQYWHHPERGLMEIRRVLQYGGTVLIALGTDAGRREVRGSSSGRRIPDSGELQKKLTEAGFCNMTVEVSGDRECAVAKKE